MQAKTFKQGEPVQLFPTVNLQRLETRESVPVHAQLQPIFLLLPIPETQLRNQTLLYLRKAVLDQVTFAIGHFATGEFVNGELVAGEFATGTAFF